MTAWRTAVPRLSRFAVEHLLLLPLGAAIALVWVNLLPESYFTFSYAIAFAVNDIAMVFFFALITKEVVEATAAGGVLHPWRRALLPVVASIGAMVVPALLHIQIVEALEEPMLVGRLAGVACGRSRRDLLRRETHFPAAPDRPVPAPARHRVRCDRPPGACPHQSDD